MNTHTIQLKQYHAKAIPSPLYLGTAGSHGNEQLNVVLGEGWEGLTVQVIFHPCQVSVQLPENGLLDVPWEATAEALTSLQGRIVFQGFNSNRLVNSTDLNYTVASHSLTTGRDEAHYTPGIVEKVLNQMTKYKEEILTAAKSTHINEEKAKKLIADIENIIKNNLQQAKDSGEFDGPQGLKGDRGDTGPQGPKGEKGDVGAPGIGQDEYDALFAALLDGSNTTRLFWIWWPSTESEGFTKYQRLERFAKILALSAQHKTYTVRFSTAGDYFGTPLDNLADGREAAPLLTNTDSAVVDWAAEDPMTWYIRANALSLADGTMNILAVEGEAEFDLTGETAPVYCFALATAMKEWEDDHYIYNSWRTMTGDGYEPMAGDVSPDGSRRWLTWHPAFYGGLNSSGGMTSGAGLAPMQFTSASDAISLARRITAYDALWNDCDQQYILSQWRLRHWTLSNSGMLEGCTLYNYQYKLAVMENNVKRVIVTKAQGANFIIGSAVCVGDPGEHTDIDRGNSYMRNIVSWARILNISDVVVDDVIYSALDLDITNSITTTTTMYVSTMPWESGTTDKVPGHSDGCCCNLTDGHYPYRIAGIEMQNGAYIIQLEPLWNITISDNIAHYEIYSCHSGENQTDMITTNYKNIGAFDAPISVWSYIRSLAKLGAEAIVYKEMGGSSSTFLRAGFYSPNSPGLRTPWRGGNLAGSGFCGLPCAAGSFSPKAGHWYGAPRLSGSGKKRGHWQQP